MGDTFAYEACREYKLVIDQQTLSATFMCFVGVSVMFTALYDAAVHSVHRYKSKLRIELMITPKVV